MPTSTKRLAAIDANPDDAIDALDIPELDEAFFQTARLTMPGAAAEESVTLRPDEDELA